MLTTLRVKNGVYSDMQYLYKQHESAGDVVVYKALFKMRDGYREMRYVSVQNDTVVAWNT